MSQYPELVKIIKKGKKIEQPKDLLESLLKHISKNFSEKISREIDFMTLYYGLRNDNPVMTLESIGKFQNPPITRERVRQIIDSVLDSFKNTEDANNPYKDSYSLFMEILGNKKFLRNEDLFCHPYFYPFKKNIKGLISFFNDCGIRQIAYRKNYYFYPSIFDRTNIINAIQKDNKISRRVKTLEKMSLKSKTVTYVPDDVREYLLSIALLTESNLNPMYEKIILEFIDAKPFLEKEFQFSKTKSWKARKGTAQWQQIGIYIEKDIFDLVKSNVDFIKSYLNKRVSLMSFICQAFVWYKEKNNQ